MQAGLPVILLFGFGVVGLSASFFELSPLESLWQEKRITKARVTNARQPGLQTRASRTSFSETKNLFPAPQIPLHRQGFL